MTDKKVSALTDGTTANDTDRIPVARSPFGSGDNAYITPAYLDTYMASTTKTLSNKTLTAPTLTGVVTLTGGTVNGTVLDISQTWGSTGTYTGINYDVADSGPSNAASLLLTLKVGGTSKFNVTKGGVVGIKGLADAGGNYQVQLGGSGYQFGNFAAIGASGAVGGTGSITIAANYTFGFTGTSSNPWLQPDTILSRGGAAATLQLGAADAASPVAQTVQFQSSTSTNNTGADATFIASRSAGSGASGKIIFKGGVTGASSGTTNTSVAALTITSGTTNNTNVGYPSVVVGAGAAVATNATDGFLYIPTCAGTPTGTPTTQTGAAPLVVDSSNNKLYVYVGGAWTAMN